MGDDGNMSLSWPSFGTADALALQMKDMILEGSTVDKYLGEEVARAHHNRIKLIKRTHRGEKRSKMISAAMQELDSRIFAHRFYHESPNDVFELFVTLFSDAILDLLGHGYGNGGLNVLRLVSKRCMQVVESVATRLTNKENACALPVAALKRCTRIEHIGARYNDSFHTQLIESLEGCPDGLLSLCITDGSMLKSLGPLSTCTKLMTLRLPFASVTDLHPLSHCKKLTTVDLTASSGAKDLSPLCQCPDIKDLFIGHLSSIKDLTFLETGFAKLTFLDISCLQVEDLSPLMKLPNLEELYCNDIPRTTSLLPLARCCDLKSVDCSEKASGLDELKKMRPQLVVFEDPCENGNEEDEEEEEEEEEGYDDYYYDEDDSSDDDDGYAYDDYPF